MGGLRNLVEGPLTLELPPAPAPLRRVDLVARLGRVDDVDALYRLAQAGGVGLTNLPPDRGALAAKLAASMAAMTDANARETGAPVLFLVEAPDGRIVATSCVFPRVGGEWPFYSFRMVRQTRTSRAAARSVPQTLLHLANDFDGEAEVGGLFVDPGLRGAAAGTLAARTRYLFIAQHRDWFRSRVIAELRGWQDADAQSPVWDALGAPFYGMGLAEADRFGALNGNQFIMDLGPRHPIYISMLPAAARAALGRPHDDGRRAHDMLIAEGFRQQGYVDIFDGGPTLSADIDSVRTVRESRVVRAETGHGDGVAALVCAGTGPAFRVVVTASGLTGDAIGLEPAALARLGVEPGAEVRATPL